MLFGIITLFSLLSAVYFSDYVKVHFLLQYIAIDCIYIAIAFSTLRKLRQSEVNLKKMKTILHFRKSCQRSDPAGGKCHFFSFNQQ